MKSIRLISPTKAKKKYRDEVTEIEVRHIAGTTRHQIRKMIGQIQPNLVLVAIDLGKDKSIVYYVDRYLYDHREMNRTREYVNNNPHDYDYRIY